MDIDCWRGLTSSRKVASSISLLERPAGRVLVEESGAKIAEGLVGAWTWVDALEAEELLSRGVDVVLEFMNVIDCGFEVHAFKGHQRVLVNKAVKRRLER